MDNLLASDYNDRIVAQAICMQITITGIKNMLVQVIPYLYAINNSLNFALFFLCALLYGRAIYHCNKRMPIIGFYIICWVILSFLLTALIYPENVDVILINLPYFATVCFATFIMISTLTSLKWMVYYMVDYSYVVIIFSVFSALCLRYYGHITMSTWGTYSMTLSYVTLIAVMWMLYSYFQNGKYLSIGFAFAGLIVIILYGSRNPLLAIFSYIVVELLYCKNCGLYIKCMVLLMFVMLVFFYREIFTLMNEILSQFDLSSRTVSLLIADEISDSGRGEIQTIIWNALEDGPIYGLGIQGDAVAYSTTYGGVSHSLYLGLLVNYGYIIGSILIVGLFLLCYEAYKVSFGQEKHVLLLSMCLVLPRGFTGGDIWISNVFWYMLGFIVVVLSRKVYRETEINDKSLSRN